MQFMYLIPFFVHTNSERSAGWSFECSETQLQYILLAPRVGQAEPPVLSRFPKRQDRKQHC